MPVKCRHSVGCTCDDCRRLPANVKVVVDLGLAIVVTLAVLGFLTFLAAAGLRRIW